MAIQTSARPDLAAYNEAMRAPETVLVQELRQLLGVRLVAFIASVKETRAVHGWAEGTRPIKDPQVLPRLRVAFQAARTIAEVESAEVAQSWMQGLNPALDDRSPARVLREGDVEVDGRAVLAAARAFARVG